MTKIEVCEVTVVHEDVVERVQNMLPDLGGWYRFLKHSPMKQDLKLHFHLR